MNNNHPLYILSGDHCEQKVEFEDWEAKYTPQDWDSSNLYETLTECCVANHGWDVAGCIERSPKQLSFRLKFDLRGLYEPENCQDADRIGNGLEVALKVGLNGGNANVTGIGDITLHRHPETGNPGKCALFLDSPIPRFLSHVSSLFSLLSIRMWRFSRWGTLFRRLYWCETTRLF